MNNDKFNLWRAIFSLVHLDSKVSSEEDNWLKEKLNNLKLTDEQKEILTQDIKDKKSVDNFVDLITHKPDRAFLLHQVRVISNLDKDYSKEEKEYFKKLEADILSNLDLEPLVQKLNIAEKEFYREDNVYSVDNKGSFFESAFMGLLRFLNPGDYKYPDKD